MKDFYKIGELSTLSGIGPDSLRYYEELGILTPKRSPNGYRLYSLQEIWKLHVLTELRALNFSMKDIREYLNQRTAATTLDLIDEEDRRLEEKIHSLRASQLALRTRRAALRDSLNRAAQSAGQFRLEKTGPFKILRLSEEVSRDEEVDYLLFKLKKEQEAYLEGLNDYRLGASMPLNHVIQGDFSRYNSVFFLLEESETQYDELVPERISLMLTCRGSYATVRNQYSRMLAEADRRNLVPDGDLWEIYQIGLHDSGNPDEYITDLILPVNLPERS